MNQGTNNHAGTTPGNSDYFEPLMNDGDTAKLLGGMHIKTLQRMARNGQVPAHRIGRYWYFRVSELDAWLKKTCAVSHVC